MSRSIFKQPQFNDEAAAYAYVEARLWPEGPICPHCGVIGQAGKLSGKTDRIGSYKCYACRKKFSVKVGTIFESSHITMRDWLTAIHLLCSSKKGISANQLSRTLGLTLKSAWFMGHRIREAMRDGSLAPMGGTGQIVEADETYFGEMPEAKHRRFKTTGRPFSKRRHGTGNKRAVVALVERGGGVRSFHPAVADGETVAKIVRQNIHRESRLHTDESRLYTRVGEEFAAHETVKHSDEEYVRSDVTTNTVEGYFSIFKRGMRGVYQHCAEKNLHRYLAEYDFRFNNRVRIGINDEGRADLALQGAVGKRLTYSDSSV